MTSTNAPGNSSTNPNPHRGVIPKRGYVTQRSGAATQPKSDFAALSGMGHEANSEFHGSPLPGGSPQRRISLALLPPTPGELDTGGNQVVRTHPWEVLEHVPPQLNQGDSRGAEDGRVYRH